MFVQYTPNKYHIMMILIAVSVKIKLIGQQ